MLEDEGGADILRDILANQTADSNALANQTADSYVLSNQTPDSNVITIVNKILTLSAISKTEKDDTTNKTVEWYLFTANSQKKLWTDIYKS